MSFTGASVVGDETCLAFTGDASNGYHLLIVEGYASIKSKPTGEAYRSDPFMVGGHLFYIVCYPNGDMPENAEFISVHVGLYNNVALAKQVNLQMGLSFAEEIVTQESTFIRAHEICAILSGRTCAGFSRFIKREELEKSKYLKDDSFTIRCNIIMVDDDSSTVDTGTSSPSIEVPPSEIKKHFSDLLLSEEGTDVTFDVSGEKIAAHRCVLAARSPVFKAQLFGKMKEGIETTRVIEVDDINAQVFRAMLSFIYSDWLPEIDQEQEDSDVMWQHLLIAADRYDLRRLRLMCEEKLSDFIDVTTVVSTILTLAEQHNCPGLKETCLKFLNSTANLQKVMAVDGLDNLATCCPSVLKDLIAKLASVKK